MPHTNVSHSQNFASSYCQRVSKRHFLRHQNLKSQDFPHPPWPHQHPQLNEHTVHREVLSQRHAVRITVDTLNCYHTCSITHLHFSSAITLMSAHTLERHPAQSCLSVCFSLPHIPIHTDTEPFCRSDHCFILCHVLILVCAGSMLIC